MSWLSKNLKKVVKHVKKKPWVIDPVSGSIQIGIDAAEGIKKSWTDIRTPLAYAGLAAATAFSGGLAAGYTIPAAAGMAAAGAAAGAASGQAVREGEKAADRAAAEQERIAAEEAEKQRQLSLLQAGQTPEGVSELSLEVKKRMRSQYKRNQVSRQENKTIGGSSSTLA